MAPDELDNLWDNPAATSQKMEMMQLLIDRKIALRSKSLVPTHQACREPHGPNKKIGYCWFS
jgi:hypothetical protein